MGAKVYKAAEVCETAGLQPYVLRSWEKEFPGIGVQKSPDTARLYRQSDLDQVLRIKQLVFGEGLTLAGARRRLEGAPSQSKAGGEEIAEVLDALGADARARIAHVRTGLRSILDVLSKAPGVGAATPGVGGSSSAGVLGAASGEGRSPGPAERQKRPVTTRGKAPAAAKRTLSTTRGAASRKTESKRKRATQRF